jgi:hypothetical protein
MYMFKAASRGISKIDSLFGNGGEVKGYRNVLRVRGSRFWVTARAAMIAILFALLSMPAFAADTTPTFVTSYTSNPGESLDAFAVRIAPDAFKQSEYGEICGEFSKAGDTYSIDMYTIKRWQECSYTRVKGREYIGLTYHTHVVLGFDQAARNILSNPRFSEADYAHPGYMTSGKKVLFQNGKGTERVVKISSP